MSKETDQNQPPVVGIASCCNDPFNQTSVEQIVGMMHKVGIETTPIINEADKIIVQTCAFLASGECRTLAILQEIRRAKRPDAEIITTGCFNEKHKGILEKTPDIAKCYGNHREEQVVRDIAEKYNISFPGKLSFADREVFFSKEYVSLIVSDGCNWNCTYCSFPNYRGEYKSRPIDDIETELKSLINQGVKKVLISALETTQYGQDLGEGKDISDVISLLNQYDEIEKIVLVLAHPAGFTEKLLNTIQRTPKVEGIAMPIQHINSDVLRRMGRRITKEQICSLIKRIKTDRPDISISTDVIVGFPGETEENFQELVYFLKENWFSHFGVVAYSEEPSTSAIYLKPSIPKEVRQKRRETILELFPNAVELFTEAKHSETLEERLSVQASFCFKPNSPHIQMRHEYKGRQDIGLETMDNDVSKLWQLLFKYAKTGEIERSIKFISDNFTPEYLEEIMEYVVNKLNNPETLLEDREDLIIYKNLIDKAHAYHY